MNKYEKLDKIGEGKAHIFEKHYMLKINIWGFVTEQRLVTGLFFCSI